MTYYLAYQFSRTGVPGTQGGHASTFLDFANEVPLGKGLVQLMQTRLCELLDEAQPGEHSVVILNMTRMEGP